MVEPHQWYRQQNQMSTNAFTLSDSRQQFKYEDPLNAAKNRCILVN